ncbi:MAG: extracellular solute-binding protein, partial [Eubacteriales bacterium]|nr:extracellular solute-binding protein [Eubacteriales bacterium]
GDTPDLIRVAVEGFELFRTNGLIASYAPYIEKYPEWAEMVSDNHEKLSAPYIVDGEYYGYGFDWNSVLTFINTNVLTEAGLELPTAEEWNWDKFVEYAKAMTFTREDGTKVYGVQVPNWYFVVESWLYNNNASILNSDFTEAVCNSPEAVEVIQRIHDLIYVDQVAPIDGADFKANTLGMMFTGRWSVKDLIESDFDACAVLPVPTMATQQAIAGGGCFPISATSQCKDEAYKLACWLSSPEAQATIMSISAVPCSTSAMEKTVSTSTFPINSNYFVDVADTAKFVEAPAQYAAVDEAFCRYLGLVLANEMEPQAAMDAAKDEIDLILAGF